jgi:hypothetical protein
MHTGNKKLVLASACTKEKVGDISGSLLWFAVQAAGMKLQWFGKRSACDKVIL